MGQIASQSNFVIETRGLAKSYGGVTSLANCNLLVPEGCVFGLVGPNGAGKTTLIRLLLGFLQPTAGRGSVCGFDCQSQSLQVREVTSYLPGEARLYRSMRGTQLLELFAGLRKHGSLDLSREVARRLDLDLGRRVMFMSTGMRQKLALSIVLGTTAPLTVLDEPTANLDPTVRAEILQLVREIREQGRSVLFSSHIFSDIEQTCDAVAMLKQGLLVFQQPLSELPEIHVVRGTLPTSDSSAAFERLPFVRSVTCGPQAPDGDPQRTYELQLVGSPNQWLPWLAETHFDRLSIEKAGLEELYRSLHAVGAGGESQ